MPPIWPVLLLKFSGRHILQKPAGISANIHAEPPYETEILLGICLESTSQIYKDIALGGFPESTFMQ